MDIARSNISTPVRTFCSGRLSQRSAGSRAVAEVIVTLLALGIDRLAGSVASFSCGSHFALGVVARIGRDVEDFCTEGAEVTVDEMRGLLPSWGSQVTKPERRSF